MKKALLMTLALITAASLSLTASAGAFDEYYDYVNEDGTYSYYFSEGVIVTMDEDWYQNTFVKVDGYGASFYHRDSYDLYEKEGYVGGWLFTIGASVNTDFKDLPSFDYLGFDEENAMNYFVVYPTDYQGYEKDPDVSAKYQELWSSVEEIVDEIEIPGDDDDGEDVDPDDVPSSMLMGGWAVTEDADVTQEAREALEKATKTLVGAEYEPVALLATQIVAGTNYCLLCRETAVVPDAQATYALVYVYADLQGGAQIIGVRELSFGIDDLDYADEGSMEDVPEMDDLED